MNEGYQLALLSSWLGGWEGVSGNPDIYIFRGDGYNDKFRSPASPPTPP